MNPTLVAPAVLEIEPYADVQAVRPGDVIYYECAGQPVGIVHRVVRVAPGGFVTRGDNNPHDDLDPVDFGAITGRIVAAQCGTRRQIIHGGRRGLWRHLVLRGLRGVNRRLSTALHAPYVTLARRGVVWRVLPAVWRPRVAAFQATQVLLLGTHVIGRYDPPRQAWVIRRPFRLLVDPALLESAVQGAVTGTSRPAAPAT